MSANIDDIIDFILLLGVICGYILIPMRVVDIKKIKPKNKAQR